MKQFFVIAIAALVAAGCAMQAGPSAPSPALVRDNMLVGESGKTLYVFDRDTDGKSACNGPCATNWPPLVVIGDAKPHGAYTVVTREDGRKQWAYKGKPLYFWAKDAKVGDTTGDNFNNVWHIARP